MLTTDTTPLRYYGPGVGGGHATSRRIAAAAGGGSMRSCMRYRRPAWRRDDDRPTVRCYACQAALAAGAGDVERRCIIILQEY